MKWSVLYVLTVTAFGYDAFSADPRLGWVGELLAFVLLLPSVFVALPVIYVVGAAAWNVREGMAGQPMWPVTLTFTVMFLGFAVANAWVVRFVARGLTTRSPLPPPPAPEQ